MSEPKKDTTPKPVIPVDWRRLHLWQIQPVRDGLVVAAIVGLIWLGNRISVVTVPMLLAILLAYLFEPLIRKVTATRHVSRPGAALAIIVLAGLLVIVPLILGGVVGVVQSASLISNFAQNTGDLIKAVDNSVPEAERQAAYRRLDQGFWRWSSDSLTRMRRELREYRAHREAVSGTSVTPPLLPLDVSKPPQAQDAADNASPPPATDAGAPAPENTSREPQAAPGDVPSDTSVDNAGATPPDAADGAHADPSRPPHAAEYDFPAWKEQLYSFIDSTIEWLRGNSDALAKDIGKRALGSTGQVLAAAAGILGSVGFLIFTAFLTAFFFFFFSTGWGSVLDFWESLIPERRKGRVIDLAIQMDRVIAGFVRGRLIICFVLSLYITIAYVLIGVPSAFLIGPLIGLLFLVPYVHAIGVPIAIVLMSVEPSGVAWQNTWWWIVFAPVGVYMGAQFLDDYILSPAIQGKTTNMDTPTIVFASLAGGAIAGVYGLLIAIPAAACIKILFREVFIPRFREWANGKKPDILPIEN
ncbi:MAG TPA: AI-2E family transporter [Phycisphaerales bacterium]|nr:AI-2E family transporter [Phycisphaerales bacterium]